MAKITVKQQGRGRPLTIDTNLLNQELVKALPKAKSTLAKIRKTTSGYRGSSILGTQQTLPDWLEMTYKILDRAESGQRLSIEQAKMLRQGVRTTQKLASQKAISRQSALSEYFSKQFYQDIDQAMKMQSEFTKKQFRKIEKSYKTLTPRQQQKFMLSKGYQDYRTLSRSYRRIKAWAESNTGRTLTYAESDAYLLRRRMQDHLSTDFMEYDGKDLPF